MDCHELDNLEKRLDAFKATHPNEARSLETFIKEMSCTWKILSHASHGHEDKPCPDDRAQLYNCGQ
jgi:hypothetical protein